MRACQEQQRVQRGEEVEREEESGRVGEGALGEHGWVLHEVVACQVHFH